MFNPSNTGYLATQAAIAKALKEAESLTKRAQDKRYPMSQRRDFLKSADFLADEIDRMTGDIAYFETHGFFPVRRIKLAA